MTRDSAVERIVREAARLGISVDSQSAGMLDTYLTLLRKWNQRINLTGTRDEHELIEWHLVDCLALVEHIPTEARSLIDVGSGGGFPAVMIAIRRPGLRVTALEPTSKKLAFLSAVRRELGLDAFEPRSDRVEQYRRAPGFEARDVATSRATFALNAWLATGAQLVRSGGLVLGMEGSERAPLPEGAIRHPYTLSRGRSRSIVAMRVDEAG